MQMVAQTLENVAFFSCGDFAFHFVEREMNDVVMVNFFARQLIGQLQPQPMQKVDFLRR